MHAPEEVFVSPESPVGSPNYDHMDEEHDQALPSFLQMVNSMRIHLMNSHKVIMYTAN